MPWHRLWSLGLIPSSRGIPTPSCPHSLNKFQALVTRTEQKLLRADLFSRGEDVPETPLSGKPELLLFSKVYVTILNPEPAESTSLPISVKFILIISDLLLLKWSVTFRITICNFIHISDLFDALFPPHPQLNLFYFG